MNGVFEICGTIWNLPWYKIVVVALIDDILVWLKIVVGLISLLFMWQTYAIVCIAIILVTFLWKR